MTLSRLAIVAIALGIGASVVVGLTSGVIGNPMLSGEWSPSVSLVEIATAAIPALLLLSLITWDTLAGRHRRNSA